ncbi:hypothetical protein GTO89_00740 [Heliobacterium gestii]|uniref:Uncharacterized protein n=1 Tax=Heliomicrobium gestii TaxID=2699 RepID=A0A845L4R6_HELGE|nr:hypothetical protein [Heliomicrobium gestii]MBM7865296.1 hypothetical protein [Heliomicrobium gestii]MZP41557.1 hypothetical protein [Heliomicrobium gestii]
MPIELWIDDGKPWYLSNSIWLVPGTDPAGAPGLPVVDRPAFVWARVINRGSAAVPDVTVRFYWGDPSTLIRRKSDAKLIGVSNVSLAAGEAKEVLCLTPWIPVWVNGGHECLIVEAFSSGDPLSPHGEDDPFNPVRDRHTAQRNLAVLKVSSSARLVVAPFAIGNSPLLRVKEVTVRVKRLPLRNMEEGKTLFGFTRLPEEMTDDLMYGIRPFRCGEPVEESGEPVLTIPLEPDRKQAMAFTLKLPERRDAGACFLIEQFVHDQVVGGIVALITPEHLND